MDFLRVDSLSSTCFPNPRFIENWFTVHWVRSNAWNKSAAYFKYAVAVTYPAKSK